MRSLEEGARYTSHTLAIYTWVLYCLSVHVSLYVSCADVGHADAVWPRDRLPLSSGNVEQVMLEDESGPIEGDNLRETHKTALCWAQLVLYCRIC